MNNRHFYEYIEEASFSKKLAGEIMRFWLDYLSYSATFLLARAWIKMFTDFTRKQYKHWLF